MFFENSLLNTFKITFLFLTKKYKYKKNSNAIFLCLKMPLDSLAIMPSIECEPPPLILKHK